MAHTSGTEAKFSQFLVSEGVPMFTKKPHGDDLKHDFVLITVEEPERLTYSVIGYESDPNDHWGIRQSATTTTE